MPSHKDQVMEPQNSHVKENIMMQYWKQISSHLITRRKQMYTINVECRGCKGDNKNPYIFYSLHGLINSLERI